LPTRSILLEFPAGGINRRSPDEAKSPFTTPDAVNVRTVGVLEKKRRGGSRPFYKKRFATELGSGNPVNLLNSLRTTDISGAATFLDALPNDNNWDTASWADATLDFATTPGLAIGPSVTAAETTLVWGNVLKTANVPAMNQSLVRTIYAFVNEGVNEANIDLYANMDKTSPLNTDSVGVRLSRGSSGSGTNLFITIDDLETSGQISAQGRGSGWLSLKIEPEKLTAEYQEISTGAQTLRAVRTGSYGAVAGDSIGFSSSIDNTDPADTFDTIRVEYTTASPNNPPEMIIAASNGQLYRESEADPPLVTVGTNITLETDSLQSVPRLGRLYIADFAVPRKERTTVSSNATLNASTGVLTDTDATFDTAGDTFVIAGGDVIELTTVTGGDVATGFYKVTAVGSATTITIQTLAGDAPGTTDATALAYRIIPGLKVYDSSTDAATLWIATSGVLPYGCRLISTFRDTIMLSGDPNNEGVWYMSRQNDVDDWTESAVDIRSAVFGTSADSGYVIGAPITALSQFTKDYHIAATAQDMWIFRGHPRQGGGIDAVSNSIGMIGPWAHAITDENVLYFTSKTGIYRITEREASVLEEPTAISREIIPLELLDIDTALYELFMMYDPKRSGLYIHKVSKTVGSTSTWFFDTLLNAFWSDTFSNDHDALSMIYSGVFNDVVFGHRDGFLRTFDDAATSDDGTVQPTMVDIGPFRINRGRFGLIDSLEIVMDELSNDVTWAVRTGQSAQAAISAVSDATGTAVAGTNYRQSVRMSGEWAVLRLTTEAAGRWAMERIKLRLQSGAESRKF
jgi:hypothetical protein